MREQERPGLTARLLFMTVDRLSGHSRPLDAPVIQRRKTALGIPSNGQGQRKSSNYQPPSLVFDHLPPRTWCLTPDGKNTLPSSPAHPQLQSPLLSLPRGVRIMIYEEVLGNRVLHILRRRSRLGHSPCLSGDIEDCKEAACRGPSGLKMPTGYYAPTGPGNGGMIQLLQISHAVYADAVEVLYSSNTFNFDCMEGFIAMSCAVLPQRFDAIRSLQLDFRFNLSVFFSGEMTCFNDLPRWERTWRVLASMTRLEKLQMRISWPKSGGLYDTEEKKYLEPLWLMSNLQVFELSLPALKDQEKPWGKDFGESPFKITRRTAS